MFARRHFALFPALLVATPAAALPITDTQAIEMELRALRTAVQDAMQAKNAARLGEMFAEGFTHIDATGHIVDRQTHITHLLIGEGTIEDAGVAEWRLQTRGPDMAVATARSMIESKAEGRAHGVRWMQIFVRERGTWRIAASQVTRMQ